MNEREKVREKITEMLVALVARFANAGVDA